MEASRRFPLHLVQAFAPGADLIFSQAEIDGKSNGTAATPSLLGILDLFGRTAASDALHTRGEVATHY